MSACRSRVVLMLLITAPTSKVVITNAHVVWDLSRTKRKGNVLVCIETGHVVKRGLDWTYKTRTGLKFVIIKRVFVPVQQLYHYRLRVGC